MDSRLKELNDYVDFLERQVAYYEAKIGKCATPMQLCAIRALKKIYDVGPLPEFLTEDEAKEIIRVICLTKK